MAKSPNSMVGIDLGRYALKSIHVQRRGGNRVAITHYGCHIPAEPATDAAGLARNIKALLKDMGTSAKACVVSVSSPEALIRIIEQPETPPTLLRDALRLNGMTLLNQDCRGYVLDCDTIASSQPAPEVQGDVKQQKYLVGGLPRTEVQLLNEGLAEANVTVHALQLSPICIFNAFEFAHAEIFNDEAFLLVDIGHTTSTMLVGSRRELILVRSIEFGGNALIEALTGLSGEGRESVIEALDQEDEVMVEYTRVALSTLTREVGSSIGFFEARHEQTIHRIFISGGPAKSPTFVKLMSEELGTPCESWCAVAHCENAVGSARQADFARERGDLNVACGAAVAALKK